ncbi:MAG: STAS domain-containing protein [Alphaproteobacteria bacterium]|nr:STAS domain-containing protein [Alphaproteobacteria bacterium]
MLREAISARAAYWRLYVPKLVTVLEEGYDLARFRADIVAGLTVAIVALPLSMALAVASNTTPDRGLYTAIVAGFLISALGGCRFQIGGPTGAFVVVVFNVIATHGYDGLVLATLMAGLMLMLAGFAKLGTFVKYVPTPVVTGFTSGIALIILSSQVAEVFGLRLDRNPSEFVEKWNAYASAMDTFQPATFAVAMASLAAIIGCRLWRPQWPMFLIAIGVGAIAVWALSLPVTTIGTRFGALPATLPMPQLPEITLMRVRELLPSAFTIAFLAGVESLLSAVVADGMTGRRHRSNSELVAQGAANIGSALFGGIPATGAIARTATNIRAGAYSPVAGIAHALFILLFLLLLAPVASFIPLASLGAVLVVVAWNMAEVKNFRHLLKAPPADRAVLITTFVLTLITDLTTAIEVGVVLAALFFMHRMANAVEISTAAKVIDDDVDDYSRERTVYERRTDIPDDVEVFRIDGPFFFGAAARLGDVLERLRTPPKAFILRMGNVPLIDASGVAALEKFIDDAARRGTRTILCNVQPDVEQVIRALGLTTKPSVSLAKNLQKALLAAQEIAP